MSRKRLIVTTAGTVTCALAIGFVMQQGSPAPGNPAPQKIDRVALSEPAPVVAAPMQAPEPPVDVLADAPATVTRESTVDLAAVAPGIVAVSDDAAAEMLEPAGLEGIVLTSVNVIPAIDAVARPVIDRVAFEPAITDSDTPLSAPADPAMPRLGCEIHATAQAAPMAMVTISIEAPCNRNERLTIHHTGMIFTAATSAEGRYQASVPALAEAAVFVAQFDSGDGAVMAADIPDLNGLDRIALQWSGRAGFQIHAREFGAAYGAAGHVWSGSAVPADGGGTLVRLGDGDALNPNIVEIYTFPTGQATRSGTVAVTVEAEVTDTNCGRDIAAQSIELHGQGPARTQDLVLSMPDCSAVGDFLVLNNLVDDLKIAAR